MPPIAHILETALYVDDLDRAKAFYRDVIGLPVLLEGPRLVALDASEGTVLLLFRSGASRNGVRFATGFIPPHDGAGPMHMAFAITAESLPAWEAHLEAHGVAIDGRMTWELGGRSIYFRDPDGHSIELATPGTWTTY